MSHDTVNRLLALALIVSAITVASLGHYVVGCMLLMIWVVYRITASLDNGVEQLKSLSTSVGKAAGMELQALQAEIAELRTEMELRHMASKSKMN